MAQENREKSKKELGDASQAPGGNGDVGIATTWLEYAMKLDSQQALDDKGDACIATTWLEYAMKLDNPQAIPGPQGKEIPRRVKPRNP